MCYPHTAQNSTILFPLSFSPGTPKAPVIMALTLSPIHPFRSLNIHNLYLFPTLSTVLSKSFQNPFFTISFIYAIPHHHTNFNPWELELNPQGSGAKTSKVYHHTVSHIIQQNGHTFPSSFNLLNTGNDIIYSTSWYLSISFQFCLHQGKQVKLSLSKDIHHLLPLCSLIYSSYSYLVNLHSFTKLYRVEAGNVSCSIRG